MVKKAGLGCLGLFLLVVVVGAIGSALSPGSQTTPTPGQAVSSAPTPTAPATPSERLAALARDQFREHFKSAKVADIDWGELEETVRAALGGTPTTDSTPVTKPGQDVRAYATVDYSLGTQWDENMAVRSAVNDLIRFAPKVFASQGIDVLELRAFTEFKDVYGKVTEEVAIKFTVSRETAARIDWKQVEGRNIERALTLQGDGVYVHPALRQAWRDYTNR